jgi:hypothetical protein
MPCLKEVIDTFLTLSLRLFGTPVPTFGKLLPRFPPQLPDVPENVQTPPLLNPSSTRGVPTLLGPYLGMGNPREWGSLRGITERDSMAFFPVFTFFLLSPLPCLCQVGLFLIDYVVGSRG